MKRRAASRKPLRQRARARAAASSQAPTARSADTVLQRSPAFQQSPAASVDLQPPLSRRLRGYAFDPSLSTRLETAVINETVYRVRWEALDPGPVGEYVEVIDYDPASRCFYAPVKLDDQTLLAQDGLAPSEGNPQFHQQFVYSVVMTTIANFERALGRRALWAPHKKSDRSEDRDIYVQQLRVYPHALREPNAYYSPSKVALMFGYFPASTDRPDRHLPGGMVFTCLSHDIIAHETTHALLDGMHRRFIEANHRDSLAFHEAFADLVALFQRFSFSDVLAHQIRRTRGDLTAPNLLGELAQQFGEAIGNYGALRSAIGTVDDATKAWKPLQPDARAYEETHEPHARGAILVAAIFDAFIAIYRQRIADLMRIASSGTGILPAGELHPDLIARLAAEAAKAAQHILRVCIRALDYCPPVDVNFGDYLRAMITADTDLVPNDKWGYRVAIIEAFRRRGIYPRDVRTLSVESLVWRTDDKVKGFFKPLADWLRNEVDQIRYLKNRKDIFLQTEAMRARLHEWIRLEGHTALTKFSEAIGIAFKYGLEGLRGDRRAGAIPAFQVHALRASRQIGPDGDTVNHLILSLIQTRDVAIDPRRPATGDNQLKFRGGCTLIIDLDSMTLRYVIRKDIADDARLDRQRQYRRDIGNDGSPRSIYFKSMTGLAGEPFALLHRHEDAWAGDR